MAYGLKYTLSFLSDRGNDYRIEILTKDYQGAPIAKKMGVAPVLNIAQGDGCIQGTSLTFAVQADVDGELQEFYTTDNKQFQVLLYRNGAIMWQGYLLPELYSEAYVAPPYDVSLTATDQLATLKDIEYSREDEQVLLQTVLEYLLSHTQLSLPLSYHMQLSMSLGRPMLENVYINQSAYNGSNCYDVLNAILLSMNCRIMQLGNQWLVTSATDSSENYYTERNLEVRPHKTLGQMYVADVYPNGTLGLVNAPALKGATLEYNHIFKKSILKNADCESRVGWEYISHSSDDGRLPGEITSFGKIFKAYCWQLMPKNIQKDASLHLWQDVEMPADDGVTWSLSFKHLFSTNAKLLLLAITHWDDKGVQRRLTGEGWVTQWNNSDVNSYIQVTGTPKSASLAEYSDIEQYEMSTVQFTLPPSNGTLRIGFINSTANYADPLAFAPIYVTQVYFTLGAVSGSAATTTIEPNATMGQEGVVLAMGDDVDSSNAVNVALNTLRRYDGGAIAGWMIGDRQFSSYFSMMLQEYSRYFGQKKRQLQGTIMGVDVLANIYKETYSNTVYRLISADYNLLADEANVTLEEVLSNFVQFAEQIFATNNSNSFGSPTSGGSFSGGSSSVDTSQLLRRDEAAETYATKAALADVSKEIADINNDLDALNELLNSDVSGVINTWGEIVDFLDEYNESQDLASILSQMNSDIANRVHYDDFEKLQEAVDANYGAIQTLQGRVGIAEGTINSHTADIAANTKAITAIDTRVDALEALGFVLKDGYIYTEKTIVSKGEIISGRRASGTSTDVGGGGISSITAQMIADALGYVPYSSANPSGYINSSALEQYVTSRGYITADALTKANVGLGEVQNYGVFNQTSFKGKTQYAIVNSSVLEIANRIDFHVNESTADYEVSLRVASGETTKRVIYLPSAEGTLALVSQIPSVPTALKSPYALAFGNKTYDGSEAKTITAADLGALTAHQDISHLLSKDDASKTYQPIISLSNKLSYAYISGTPSLATVATSGKYSDLSGLPTIPTNNNQLTNGAGYITSAALNGYATQSWVEEKKYLTAIPSEYITESELSTTLGGYQTKISSSNKIAYSNISGTPSLASVATSGKYSDLSGVPTSLPASDVWDWAKAAVKPTYTFSEITSKPTTLGGYGITDALPLSGGTIGALVVSGTLDTTGNATIGGVLVAKGGRLRINASNTVNSFGFLKATAYTSSLNRAVLDIGSNYGGSSNVASESVDVTALSIYRGVVGVGRAYTYEELYANYNSNTKLYVDGGIANTRTHSASHWDALKIISVGSWSTAPNYVNGIGVTDGSGVVGRFGISFNGTEGGYFSVRDLYTNAGGYASSGEIFKVVGNGNVYINGNLTATGEVISSRRASASDARLKDNITYLGAADCLAMVRHIRPAEWDWKDNGKHSMGFIAQDIEHLMPYAVTSIKDIVLGQKLNLQYDQFIALAIGGVQAVDNEVERLKARVEYLENKIKEYEYGNYRN